MMNATYGRVSCIRGGGPGRTGGDAWPGDGVWRDSRVGQRDAPASRDGDGGALRFVHPAGGDSAPGAARRLRALSQREDRA